ncbi:MAG: zinc ABC transporter substrate-binding protein [Ardenticatenaceae bacterium]|nr:zinc ABC transporter substrate-binding protein [Ardenticatenaceae bacterium]
MISGAKKFVFLLTLSIFIIFAGCTPSASPEAEGKLRVVTTIGQITDLVSRVGGEHVFVEGLMGPGTDPHLFVASASDVDRLQNADVIFYNGLFLEAQLEEVLEQLAERKPTVAISGRINPADLLASPVYDDEFDPHIWFDVELWQQTVPIVRDTLIELDPDNAGAYTTNADAYLAELVETQAYVLEKVAELPPEKRVLITAHDAFNYFGNAYGFDVLGLQGISTASEASTADVIELADTIVDRQIPAIFVESSVPVRNIEAVQAAVLDRGFEVVIGGELFSDAMGDLDTPEGVYTGMVRHNVDTIVDALNENGE